MGKVKSLPVYDRPREKAIRYGLNTLSDPELIAILLGNGYQGYNVVEIATSLLSKYGGIVGLSKATFSELKQNKGIKDVKALNIATVFEIQRRLSHRISDLNDEEITSQYLYNKYKYTLLDSKTEQLVLVILNKKKKIIFETTMSSGTSENVALVFNDIYRELVLHNGTFFYMIHNHTNGSCKPSVKDKILTTDIFLRCKAVKKYMLDHIIIAEDGFYSFDKNEKNMICY